MAEAPWIGKAVMLQKADDPLDTRRGTFGNPYEEIDEDDSSADILSGDGIQVRRSGKMTPVYRSVSSD